MQPEQGNLILPPVLSGGAENAPQHTGDALFHAWSKASDTSDEAFHAWNAPFDTWSETSEASNEAFHASDEPSDA